MAGQHRPGDDRRAAAVWLLPGERSSRQIERRCVRHVAYRVIVGGLHPDHATIARVRARHEKALGGPFTQVLRLLAAGGSHDAHARPIRKGRLAEAPFADGAAVHIVQADQPTGRFGHHPGEAPAGLRGDPLSPVHDRLQVVSCAINSCDKSCE